MPYPLHGTADLATQIHSDQLSISGYVCLLAGGASYMTRSSPYPIKSTLEAAECAAVTHVALHITVAVCARGCVCCARTMVNRSCRLPW